MDSTEDQKGAPAPEGENSSPAGEAPAPPEANSISYAPTVDDSYGYGDDPYQYAESRSATVEPGPPPAVVQPGSGRGSTLPPAPPASRDEQEDEEEGMLRMSFLEHLEELRSRILKALAGVGIAFVLSLTFSSQLWLFVQRPAEEALKALGYKQKGLVTITPMEAFNIVWVKLPILTAVFLASPWILYQVWAFISPGLYKRERRWAAPFVIGSASLFIIGGIFAYFVAFRYGLVFLLGIGRDINITPMVTANEYFDLFVNVIVGIGLVFEMPVLIFFLTLLHIVSPRFLLAHSRYAILAIVIIAAIVTPTPDAINLMLFATPMCMLFFLGIFASYLLVLHREERKFPWRKILRWTAAVAVVLAAALYFAMYRYGYHLVSHWPFLTR